MPRGCARVTVAPWRCQAIGSRSVGIGGFNRLAEPRRGFDDHARRVVLGEDPEVERRELRFAHPADAGGEGDPIRARRRPVEQVDCAHSRSRAGGAGASAL